MARTNALAPCVRLAFCIRFNRVRCQASRTACQYVRVHRLTGKDRMDLNERQEEWVDRRRAGEAIKPGAPVALYRTMAVHRRLQGARAGGFRSSQPATADLW